MIAGYEVSVDNRIGRVRGWCPRDSPVPSPSVLQIDDRHRLDSRTLCRLSQHLDERGRRVFAATEAKTAGYGGIAALSRATGMGASTIGRGLKELVAAEELDPGRVRRPGGGGKKRVMQDTTLLGDLLALVEPDARGDPMSPLRWTCKSLSQLTQALAAMGHRVGRTPWLVNCCTSRSSACKATARRARGRATQTAMRSSIISMRACGPHWRRASR